MGKVKNFTFDLIKKLVPRGVLVSLKTSYTLAFVYGQFRTAQKWESCDRHGQPVPWYTYPCIEYIDNHNLANLTVFEYGSGNSSLYYLKQGARVISIENHKEWFDKISAKTSASHTYVFETDESKYVERPEVLKSDIIVIDGSYRTQCANFVIKQLNAGDFNPAMIIFDNSEWYPDSVRNLDLATSWPRVDFCGFIPIGSHASVTSIYVNPKRLIPRKTKNTVATASIIYSREWVPH